MQGQMVSGVSNLEAMQRKRRHGKKLLQRRLATWRCGDVPSCAYVLSHFPTGLIWRLQRTPIRPQKSAFGPANCFETRLTSCWVGSTESL